MKSRSILYKITKTTLLIVSTPIILFWALIILLYIPPIQRYAVDTVCKSIEKSTGYNIEIGTIHLSFPIKLNIYDFSVADGDNLIASGEKANVNISFMPLLTGEVEVNYVSLEQAKVNTGDIIPGIAIDGSIGYFRTVARNIDLTTQSINLRQIHLHSADISVTIDSIPASDDEESEPLGWAVRLRKGAIENCNVALTMPGDTLSVAAHIGKLTLRRGNVNLADETYKVASLALKKSTIKYDRGAASKEEAPLDHIEINEINLDCGKFEMTPKHAKVDINNFTLIQPGGIRITETSASLYCDYTLLDIQRLLLRSKNGSHINIRTTIPWLALGKGIKPRLNAAIELGVNKRDLSQFLTPEQYDALSLFKETMAEARMELSGNLTQMDVDTLELYLPGVATLNAAGDVARVNDIDNLAAKLNINGRADDIRTLMGVAANNPNNQGRVDIEGTVGYDKGTATALLTIFGAEGTVKTDLSCNIDKETYSADIEIDSIDISHITPSLPLNNLSMNLTAQGEGFDIFSKATRYDLALQLDTLHYQDIALSRINLNASQASGLSKIELRGNAPDLKLQLDADTRISSKKIESHALLDLAKAELGKIGLIAGDVGAEAKLDIDLMTDLDETHSVRLNGNNIRIDTPQRTYTPATISLDAYTSPEHSYIKAHNGDLSIAGSMESGYNGLLKSLDKIAEMFLSTLESDQMAYYLHDYEKQLPTLNLEFKCGRSNMLANLLALNDLRANHINLNAKVDTLSGLNIIGGVYGLNTGDIRFDTIGLFTKQKGNKLRYFAGVRSSGLNPDNEKETYNATLYGDLTNDSLTTNVALRDKSNKIGLKIGATTILKPGILDIHFSPLAQLMGEEFFFNDDNFIRIGKKMSIDADVTLNNNDNAGMHIYTTDDGESKYNANLELFNIDLKGLTSILPYAPDVSGILNLDTHLKYNEQGMQLSADLSTEDISYEGVYIGNEIVEAVYFPKGDNSHYLDLLLLHNEEEVAHINGNYNDTDVDEGLDGEITLTNFPLSISRAFMQDMGINLDGYISGNMSAKGKLTALDTNGRIQFQSVNIDAYGFGTNLHMADEVVSIRNNKLQFRNFSIYALGSNPFKINGSVDFSTLTNPIFNLRMNANEYELINTKRKKGSMFYGKLFVDTKVNIGGALDNLKIQGNVTMLGKSNLTYVMLDAPIESDKELDGLVEFVNFNDTTAVVTKEQDINLGNMNLDLSLDIQDGARINADLDEGRNNYVTTQGSGTLNLKYSGDAGLYVAGAYAMREGEFKLSLPIIPLKTLNIIDGSVLSWEGAILNPKMNITAVERVTSSVTFDDNSTLPVAFDVGVKVSNTLEKMGLSFIMSAPENATVQDQLNALDPESMNRYAVTMLITGAYAGSSKNMTVSNALSSFIDAKINDITGTAMKSVNVNFGINDATNAETGSTYKNYSFSFSKRFWNDRITVVIGGEVNSGEHATNNTGFINNASIEWKLSENSNRYLKLFYDKNFESILEGEITETGIGYVYKRKLSKLKDLFTFKRKKKQEKREGAPQTRAARKERKKSSEESETPVIGNTKADSRNNNKPTESK